MNASSISSKIKYYKNKLKRANQIYKYQIKSKKIFKEKI